MQSDLIGSIEEFIGQIRTGCEEWESTIPWFRGEPGNVDAPLLPKLFRPKKDGSRRNKNDENNLLQSFRMRAPSLLGFGQAVDRGDIDQWLFLAQHVGLPTRLLDWTGGALIALYFALEQEKPIVWMLNPIQLNLLSTGLSVFGLPWVPNNFANENVRRAWTEDDVGVELPVPVYPTNIHARMSVQRSCFTIHGKKEEGLDKLVPQYLKRYAIDSDPDKVKQMQSELRMLGISRSTLFPDLDGLARELAEIF